MPPVNILPSDPKRKRHRTRSQLGAALLLGSVGLTADDTRDALAPTSSAASALTGPLHTVTISTTSLEETRLFYVDGLGLRMEGPLPVSERQRQTQRRLWGVDEDVRWETYRLHREGVEGTAQIRLLALAQPSPAIHRSWSALELGSFSIGFPNLDQTALDRKMRALGFGALNLLERYSVPRTDGTEYPIEETIFNGPDFVHAVGINRGDGMAQLGPVDKATGYGGPAYSAAVVEDSNAMIRFLVDGLGLELRSDRTWKSAGSDGALNVPDGTVFRFSILYSPGARSQHLLLVDYENVAPQKANLAPRVPRRGIGMWTFETRDMDTVLARIRDVGVTVVAEPFCVDSPIHGIVRAMTLEAPNGLLVELLDRNYDCYPGAHRE